MSSQHTTLGSLVRIRTGKLDANANDPKGDFPFFTCAVEPLKIASYSYDCECVLVAGNGDLNVKYYSGKFDAYQRTYIIESLNSAVLNVRYLFHFLERYLDKLRHMSIGGVIKYIKLGNLTDAELRLPPLSEQIRIAAILDQADALRVKRREALAQLDNLAQAIFIEMFGDPVANPKRWKIQTLQEACDFFAGSTLPIGQAFSRQEGGYFLLKVSDMNLVGNETNLITCKEWSPLKGALACTCPQGSVVFPKRGGAIGTNKKRLTTRDSVLDPNLMAITPKPTYLDLVFLYQWFLGFDLESISSGSSVPQLNKKDLAPLKIMVPPMSLQREFANRIAEVNRQKEIYRASMMELDALISSLQHRAFRGEL